MNLRRRISANMFAGMSVGISASFFWFWRCVICSSARASGYDDALSYVAVGSFDWGRVPSASQPKPQKTEIILGQR